MIVTGHVSKSFERFVPIAITVLDPSLLAFETKLQRFISAFHCCGHEALILGSPTFQAIILDKIAPKLRRSCASYVWVYVTADSKHLMGMNKMGEVGEFHFPLAEVNAECICAQTVSEVAIKLEQAVADQEEGPAEEAPRGAFIHAVYHAASPEDVEPDDQHHGLFRVTTGPRNEECTEGKVHIISSKSWPLLHLGQTACMPTTDGLKKRFVADAERNAGYLKEGCIVCTCEFIQLLRRRLGR